MQTQTTTKKVKVIGTVEYINPYTGELEPFQATRIEDRDFNFHKVWLKNIITALDIVGNQKTKVCFWLIDHLDKENKICYTQRQIAELVGVSLKTVSITMRILQDVDFLRKYGAVYIVNPNCIYKGGKDGRLNILSQYATAEKVTLSDEEKLENILHSIEQLQKQADKIAKKLAREKVQEMQEAV